MMSEEFKYKTSFDFEIFATTDIENDLSISLASLENLQPLIPNSLNLKENIDLIGVAFNAAVVNSFNKNGDGISSDTAVKIIDNFVNKPTNIEHKKEKIVGHIVNAGFTDIDTNKILSKETAKKSDSPYYISLSAVVYRNVNPGFADALLKSSDKDSELYHKISASWELGFNDYYIAVGSQDLEKARIIKDPKEIEQYNPYLKSFGGSGKMRDGSPIFRLVVGQVYPLGIGFTSNPAAKVKGLVVKNNSEEEPVEEKNEANLNIFNNKISQIQKNNVKTFNIESIMDIQDIITEFEKVLDSKLSEKSEFSQEAVASISTFLAEKIREKDVEFQKEQALLKEETAKASEEKEAAKVALAELEKQLAVANDKISQLEEQMKLQQAQEIFSSRMDTIENLYDLVDSDRQCLASDLKDMDQSEEAFASYLGKLETLLKEKSKQYRAEQEAALASLIEEEVERRVSATAQKEVSVSEASVQVEDAIHNATATEVPPVNNNGASSHEESLVEKFGKLFSKENIQIKY